MAASISTRFTTTSGDRLEIVEQGRDRKVGEEILAYGEAGLDVQRDLADDAERTEADHRAVEIGIAAFEGQHLAAGEAEVFEDEVVFVEIRPIRIGHERAYPKRCRNGRAAVLHQRTETIAASPHRRVV